MLAKTLCKGWVLRAVIFKKGGFWLLSEWHWWQDFFDFDNTQIRPEARALQNVTWRIVSFADFQKYGNAAEGSSLQGRWNSHLPGILSKTNQAGQFAVEVPATRCKSWSGHCGLGYWRLQILSSVWTKYTSIPSSKSKRSCFLSE